MMAHDVTGMKDAELDGLMALLQRVRVAGQETIYIGTVNYDVKALEERAKAEANRRMEAQS